MTSHSKAENVGRSDSEAIRAPQQACENCDCRFEPVGGAVLCGDCVRKLFEPKFSRTADQADEERLFINHYRHEDRPVQPGIVWRSERASACDDKCPACGCSISPYKLEDAEAVVKAA